MIDCDGLMLAVALTGRWATNPAKKSAYWACAMACVPSINWHLLAAAAPAGCDEARVRLMPGPNDAAAQSCFCRFSTLIPPRL